MSTEQPAKKINKYNNDHWIMRPESIASTIIGEDFTIAPSDICIYFKLIVYEQPVFDRLAKTPSATLADEIAQDKGFLLLGDIEKVKAQMHNWVDEVFINVLKSRAKNKEPKDD